MVAIAIAIVVQGSDMYFQAKEELIIENESLQDRITGLTNKLKGESTEKYISEAAAIEENLGSAQGQVLELPTENDGNMLLSKIISERAEEAGLNINSISNRKSKTISEEKELSELRTYFGYDTDLQPLLNFFSAMDEQGFYVAVESINISVRRQPRRKTKRKIKRRVQRKALNGNAILTAVFRPNAEATMEQWEKLAKQAEPADEILDDEEEGAEEAAADTKVEAKAPKTTPKKDVKAASATKPKTAARKPVATTKPEDDEEDDDEDDSDDEEEERIQSSPPKKPGSGLRRVPNTNKENGLKPVDSSEPPPLIRDRTGSGPTNWPGSKPETKPAPKPKLDPKPRPSTSANKIKSGSRSF